MRGTHRSLVTMAGLILVLAACGDDGGAATTTTAPAPTTTQPGPTTTEAPTTTEPLCDEPINLIYATSLGEDTAYYKGAVALKEAVEDLSDGCLTMEIFANAVLGTDRDMIEGMQLGSIDMASPSTGAMGAVVPEATVLDLPYLFYDANHAYCVLDGPIGAEDIAGMFEGIGFMPLGYWEIGFRNLTNNVRPVVTPADVEGLVLRTLPSNIHQRAWTLVGAQPIAMDFTELYNALDTGVVDGQENPFNIILTTSLYEVQKYMSVTNHVYGTAPTSVSDITWDRLTPALQDVLVEAVAISVVAQRDAAGGDIEGQLAELKSLGMEVVDEPDRAAFAALMAPAWDDYIDQYGESGRDLIDKIRAAAATC